MVLLGSLAGTGMKIMSSISIDEAVLSSSKNQPNRSDRPLVDLEGAMKRLGGDQELFEQFVEIFEEDAPVLMQGIIEAVESSDADSLERKSHAIKGLISNFGAQPCVETALSLEQAGRTGDLSSAASLCKKLEQLCEDLRAELKVIAS